MLQLPKSLEERKLKPGLDEPSPRAPSLCASHAPPPKGLFLRVIVFLASELVATLRAIAERIAEVRSPELRWEMEQPVNKTQRLLDTLSEMMQQEEMKQKMVEQVMNLLNRLVHEFFAGKSSCRA